MNHNLVLVDTSVWIAAMGKRNIPAIRSRITQLGKENRIATNQMVRLELLGGSRSVDEFDSLKKHLDALHQMQIGDEEWGESARLAFKLRRQGKTLPYGDIIIAVTAIRNDASLLHADQHFELIATESALVAESLVHLISGHNR